MKPLPGCCIETVAGTPNSMVFFPTFKSLAVIFSQKLFGRTPQGASCAPAEISTRPQKSARHPMPSSKRFSDTPRRPETFSRRPRRLKETATNDQNSPQPVPDTFNFVYLLACWTPSSTRHFDNSESQTWPCAELQ